MFFLFDLKNYIKQKLIILISFIFIISLFLEETIKLKSGIYRISIVELTFIILVIITILKFNKKLFHYLIDFNNYKQFEIIILIILFLKTIKYFFNLDNLFNLYELCIWIYMISIYIIYKFLLEHETKFLLKIENAFIFLSIVIAIHIIISLFLYLFEINLFKFWINRSSTYLPYMGTSTVHFTSLFSNYNHPAHLIIPGIFFLTKRYNFYKKIILFLFFIFIFLLIKSKVIIIFFASLFLFIINNIKANLNLITYKNSIIYFTLLFLFYFLITHIIIINQNIINESNSELFEQYFFTDFFFSFFNFEIYGSLFLKLKYITLLIAESYGYIFFNEINYFQSTIVREYIGKYTDPHSEYFGALANYGILGLIVFLLLPIYFIKNFYKNFQYFINEKRNFDYFLIIFIFLIEGIVLDFLHDQMLWIIFAMFNYIIFIKHNTLKN